MNLYDEYKFTIRTDDNQEKTFYNLITFKSTITNKDYIIYTDDGKNIFSSILKKDNNDKILLEKITDKIDEDEVNKALEKAKIDIKNTEN